jgi:hypothetical protein
MMDHSAGAAATISCQCGQVSVSVFAPPLRRLQCCCIDCRYGLQWCAEEGGPAPKTIPADLVYFPNALRVDHGLDLLKCLLIKEGYNTRRIVASCCWTCLLGDHPSYEGLRFVVYNNSAIVQIIHASASSEDASAEEQPHRLLLPASRRIFESDLTPEERATLSPFVVPDGISHVRSSSGGGEAAVILAQQASDDDEESKYITVQTLIDMMIGKIEFMNPLFEGTEPIWNTLHPDSPGFYNE